MYASVADLRAEGVTAAEASDARLELLLAEASSLIDRVTGWFFEPRLLTLHLAGRGAPSIELPVPPIRVDRLVLGGAELALDPSGRSRPGLARMAASLVPSTRMLASHASPGGVDAGTRSRRSARSSITPVRSVCCVTA